LEPTYEQEIHTASDRVIGRLRQYFGAAQKIDFGKDPDPDHTWFEFRIGGSVDRSLLIPPGVMIEIARTPASALARLQDHVLEQLPLLERGQRMFVLSEGYKIG
jgi:hypothetical protein